MPCDEAEYKEMWRRTGEAWAAQKRRQELTLAENIALAAADYAQLGHLDFNSNESILRKKQAYNQSMYSQGYRQEWVKR